MFGWKMMQQYISFLLLVFLLGACANLNGKIAVDSGLPKSEQLIVTANKKMNMTKQGYSESSALAIEAQRSLVVETAKSQVGRAYRYGGNHPVEGFDCSGLVQYAYQSIGVSLPRTTHLQASYLGTTTRPEIGDIIFFKVNGRAISHSGIYLGDNLMVHSPSRGKRVEIARIDDDYWGKRFYKFGRL